MQDEGYFSALLAGKGGVKVTINPDVVHGKGIKKTPTSGNRRGDFKKDRRRHTLPHCSAVPSAQVGLTSLFGMGRGDHHRYSHRKTIERDTTCRVPTIRFDI